MSLKPLTPPLRFSTVAFACTDEPQPWQTIVSADSADPRSHPHHHESVYRGAYPKTRNLYFLSRLHLRTVLSLTPRPLDNDEALLAWSTSSTGSTTSSSVSLADKVSNAGIQLLHVRCEKPKDESGGLTREGAARALSILLDRRNHPIYVHCLDGVEVTSTLVACMRKVQAWSNPAILAELGRALRDSNSSEWVEVPSHLSSFLNKFGQPDGIRLPPRNHIPSWLWPSPNPLSVLADPYAWAGPPSANGHEQNGASSGGSSTAPSHPTHHSRRDRQLPIHHPTLKLHFDVDPDLPPEPAAAPPPILAASTAALSAQRPSTPSRSLQHSRTSSYNSIANVRSPPHSRPASRAGRPSQLASSRSASQASEDDRAGSSSARRSESTARDFSLLGQGGDMATSAVPSIAAFLEDQLQDHSSAPFFHHGVHESPTRRSRLIIETLPSSLPDRSSPTKAHAPHAPSDADEEIDVSTPRARPTTSSTIGITGTIFHHDDEITDSEDASPARNLGSSRIVVPLEQRRRLLDEADGEATPTRTSAMHNAVQRISRDERELQGRRQESTVSVDSFESSEGADRGQDMVQSPTAYADDEDYVTQRRKGGSQNDSDQDADESQTDGSQSEEEAEEEEEEEEEEEDEDEEEEEEEEDDEDEDEDDLALEALDLEGY